MAELEVRVKARVASHAACVRAVMLHGGMQALEKFWADYKVIADTIRSLDAMPDSAEVIGLTSRGGKPTRD